MPEETCCHSDSVERPPGNIDMKNLKGEICLQYNWNRIDGKWLAVSCSQQWLTNIADVK